jgi:hypothetical protein
VNADMLRETWVLFQYRLLVQYVLLLEVRA